MFGASFRYQLRSAARRFVGASEGNIAVIFAIALVPVLGFVGAAIDYTRANSARSSMQAALDSTALMLSKDLSEGTITTSQVSAKAQTYFTALYTNKGATLTGPVTATYTANSSLGSSIQVNGSGAVTTDFLKVAGFPNINFNTSSTAAWGNVRMRVAMALDNTGSMSSDGKIGALQTAAKSLVDQLSGLAKASGDVYISVVPFAKDVNIGSSNYSESWIDWTDWEAEAPSLQGSKPSGWSMIGPGSDCPWSMRNDGFTCINGPASTSAVSSIPSSGQICPGPDSSSRFGYAYHYLINGCYSSVASASTPNFCTGSSCSCNGYANTCSCSGSGSSKVCKQPTYTHVWTPNNHNTWSGCIADRTQDYDTRNSAPVSGTTASLFPAENYYENNESYCATGNNPLLQPVTPLSYNWSSIKTGIDAMQPTGGTNQPIGLALAWQTLAQTAPFSAPAEDSNYTYKKAIILLSDGLNTENRWPAYGDGSNQTGTMIDDRQKILCDNVKAAGITIYTVQLNTSTRNPDPTSTVLQYCASGLDKFFLVTSADQTLTVFNSIGTSLSKLRVAR
jgi:Flp pilus assembly protein TadG